MADQMPWEKYAQAAPQAEAPPWEKYSAQTPEAPPAPLSGPIGAAPIPKALQDNPESNNRAALQSGLIGAAKSIPQAVADVGGLVNKIPRLGEQVAPRSEVNAFDQYAHADNPQEESGKTFGAFAQMAVPAGEGAEAISEAIPSTERAGRALEAVRSAGQGTPVVLSRTAPALQRLAELDAAGGSMPGAANKLLNRSQGIIPIGFPEARDFYSNISRLSGEDAQKMTPVIKRQVGELRKAFHGDLSDAANAFGMGPQYEQAMKEYGQAANLKEAGGRILKYGLGLGAGAAGLGAVENGIRKIAGH